MNYAAVAELPSSFVCENTILRVFPQLKRQALDNISARVAAFGMSKHGDFRKRRDGSLPDSRQEIASARAGGSRLSSRPTLIAERALRT